MDIDKSYLKHLEKYHRQREKIKELVAVIDEKRNLIFQETKKFHA